MANRSARPISRPRAKPSDGRTRRSRFRRTSPSGGTRASAAANRRPQWRRRFAAYRQAHPRLAAEFERRMAGDLPRHFEEVRLQALAAFGQSRENVATRKRVTAGADDAGACAARVAGRQRRPHRFEPHRLSRMRRRARWPQRRAAHQLRRARVRHGGHHERHRAARRLRALWRAPSSTFSDYSRNAIRMAALMGKRVIHVFTHDSDRPRRRRPDSPARGTCREPAADSEPGCLAPLRCGRDGSRLDARAVAARAPERLAAVAAEPAGAASPARAGAGDPAAAATSSASVLRPWQRFWPPARKSRSRWKRKSASTRAACRCEWCRCHRPACSTGRIAHTATACSVAGLPRIGVEAGVTRGWSHYGCVAALGVDRFGESAPAAQVSEHLGLTVDRLVELVLAQLPGTAEPTR